MPCTCSTLAIRGRSSPTVTRIGQDCTPGESGKERDILVPDIEELERKDASEIHGERLNAKEVIRPKMGKHFVFPIAETYNFLEEIRLGEHPP